MISNPRKANCGTSRFHRLNGIEDFFEREWARSVFSLSLERLRQDCEQRGKQMHFRLLELYDIEEAGKELTYEQVAQQFGLKSSDVTNYLAYARREFRRIVLEQLREMTGSEEEFRQEAQTLAGDAGGVATIADSRFQIARPSDRRIRKECKMKDPDMKWLSDAALDRLRAAADSPDLSGTRYELVEKLGEGGMGGVYRVEDTALGRQVALKAIRVVDSSGEFAARLLREAKIIAQLEHPGIVPVHDVGTLPDGRVFYTMKLVQGRRLDQYSLGSMAASPERLRTFQKICEAVSFAHAHNVLHRDLKPQNIMVGPFGEVLVMDWGLAKVLKAEALSKRMGQKSVAARSETRWQAARADTAHGAVLGTPGYMAPEQARGEIAAIGPRADVYSLGAVLKFLAAKIEATRQRRLAAISGKATAEDIELRYGSVEELRRTTLHIIWTGCRSAPIPRERSRGCGDGLIRNRAWILLILAYLVMRALFILWRAR